MVVDGFCNSIQQGLLGAGGSGLERRFEFGEGVLDGRKVRGVGGQKYRAATRRLDELLDAGAVV